MAGTENCIMDQQISYCLRHRWNHQNIYPPLQRLYHEPVLPGIEIHNLLYVATTYSKCKQSKFQAVKAC